MKYVKGGRSQGLPPFHFLRDMKVRKIISHFVFMGEFVWFDPVHEEFNSMVIRISILVNDIRIGGWR
jgi:hypothetical protein